MMLDTQPLVSLIVPCYNAEKKCERLMQSLLAQSYTHIQLIFINDGSTDNTEDVLMSYKIPLEATGYSFEYYCQENGGVSSATNVGLKYVRGDYLCWVDPDDYYEKDAFLHRIEYMEAHPECCALSCESYDRDGRTLEILGTASSHYPHTREHQQFELMLRYQSMFYVGCHMFRMDAFRRVNPKMEIFNARRGQNWQLILPMYYAYDRYFLEEQLFNVCVYEDSKEHSIKNDYSSRLSIINSDEEVLSETLIRMLMTEQERNKYLQIVETQAIQLRMYAAMSYGKIRDFASNYLLLHRRKALTVKDRIRWLKVMNNSIQKKK